MADENPRLQLYNNLIASKRVSQSDIGDFKTFDSLLNDESNSQKLYTNLIKSKKFTTEDLGDQNTFVSLTRKGGGGDSLPKKSGESSLQSYEPSFQKDERVRKESDAIINVFPYKTNEQQYQEQPINAGQKITLLSPKELKAKQPKEEGSYMNLPSKILQGASDLTVKGLAMVGDMLLPVTKSDAFGEVFPEQFQQQAQDFLSAPKEAANRIDQETNQYNLPNTIGGNIATGVAKTVPLVAALYTGNAPAALDQLSLQAPSVLNLVNNTVMSPLTKLLAAQKTSEGYLKADKEGKSQSEKIGTIPSSLLDAVKESFTLNGYGGMSQRLTEGQLGEMAKKGLIAGDGKITKALLNTLNFGMIGGASSRVEDILQGKEGDLNKDLTNAGVFMALEIPHLATSLKEGATDKVKEFVGNRAIIEAAKNGLMDKNAIINFAQAPQEAIDHVNSMKETHQELFQNAIEHGIKGVNSKDIDVKNQQLTAQIITQKASDIKYVSDAIKNDYDGFIEKVNQLDIPLEQKAELIDKANQVKANEGTEQPIKQQKEPNQDDINLFADRIKKGEDLTSPADQQFYANNKESIEASLKSKQQENEKASSNGEVNQEGRQAGQGTKENVSQGPQGEGNIINEPKLEQENAVQEQKTNGEVLLNGQPKLGLPEVGEGNTVNKESTNEGKAKDLTAEITKEEVEKELPESEYQKAEQELIDSKPPTPTEKRKAEIQDELAKARKEFRIAVNSVSTGGPINALEPLLKMAKLHIENGVLTAKDMVEKLREEYRGLGLDDKVIPDYQFKNIYAKALKDKGIFERGNEEIARGFAENVANTKKYAELKDAILSNDENYYTRQSREDIKKALETASNDELEKVFGQLDNYNAFDPKDNNSIMAAVMLVDRYYEAGEYDKADKIIEKASKAGTSFGQLTSQFAALNKSNPKTFVKMVEEKLKGVDRKISDEQKQQLEDLFTKTKGANGKLEKAKEAFDKDPSKANKKNLAKAQKEYEKSVHDVNYFVKDILPPKVWDKLGAIMQINLMTLKSLIQNPYGNILFTPIRFTQKSLSSLFDAVISKATGLERTTLMPNQIEAAKGFGKGVKQAYQKAIHGNSTDLTKIDADTQLRPFRAFQQLFGANTSEAKSTLDKISENTGHALEATFGITPNIMARGLALGDDPFRMMSYQVSLAEQAKLKGLTGVEKDKFMTNPDEASKKVAEEAGRTAIFEGETTISDLTKQISNASNSVIEKRIPQLAPLVRFLFKAVVPFKNVPSVILSHLLELSTPVIPTIKTGLDISRFRELNNNYKNASSEIAKNKYKEQLLDTKKKLSKDLSNIVISTSMMMAASWLIKKGLIVDQEDDKTHPKTRELARVIGGNKAVNVDALKRGMETGDFSTKPNDETVSLLSMGIVGGIILIHSTAKSTPDDITGYLARTIGATATTALNQSFLTGTNTLMTDIASGNYTDLGQQLFRAYSSIPLPNELSDLNKATRQFAPDLKGDNTEDKFKNVIKNKLWMTDDLPTKIDWWGNKIKQTPDGQDNWIYNVFDVMRHGTIPSDKYNYEVYRLYSVTKNDDVIPDPVKDNIVIDKVSQKLTRKEYEQYSEMVGQERFKKSKRILESKIPDGRKAVLLEKAYSEGAHIAKKKFVNTVLKQRLKNQIAPEEETSQEE